MTDTLTQIEFRPLVIPESVDADDAADFREMVRVRNIVYREISGHDDGAVRRRRAAAPPEARRLPPARRCGSSSTTAASSAASASRSRSQDGSKVAFWLIELLREVWGRGIGSAAYELVEQTAREHGRTVLQAWAEHPAAPGPAHRTADRLRRDPRGPRRAVLRAPRLLARAGGAQQRLRPHRLVRRRRATARRGRGRVERLPRRAVVRRRRRRSSSRATRG